MRVRLGYIKVFEFEWFYLYYFLYSTILLMNFFKIVTVNEYKFIESNHLNLGVLCSCIIFYFALFYFFGGLGFAFVATRHYCIIALINK